MEEDIIYSKKKVIEWLKVVVGDIEENMRLLAPNGWESSPLFAFFHSTKEQEYQAYLHFSQRMYPLKKNKILPTFEEFLAEDEQE